MPSPLGEGGAQHRMRCVWGVCHVFPPHQSPAGDSFSSRRSLVYVV